MPSETVETNLIRLQTSDDHHLDVWEAKPVTHPPKAGLIVIQEIFGLTDYIRTICTQLAQTGYHVMAPALFDRIQHDAILPYDQDGLDKGLELRAKLGKEAPLKDIEACLKALRTENSAFPVGVIGFCWGGYLAWRSAQSLPINAASAWYGGDIAKIASPKPRCPVQLHFGDNDSYIPASDWDIIRTACPDIPLYIYKNAEHGFGCTDRPSYKAEACELAWERTLSFFAEHLQQK
ncbi:dienelactone hydrolase family protein [Acetobacteraceae bacterium ESL0709]|nr:dienelactone hydrolase family protein [Acetobacteraceae bacterium ESL0697]MDF7677818.1 dienelactone hydrolase family protein [Acetobacteraceae bacterium ESL0709]